MEQCPARFIVETLKDPAQDARMECTKLVDRKGHHLGRHMNADGSILWDEGAEVSIVKVLEENS